MEINWWWTSRTIACCFTLLWLSIRLWWCRLLVDEVHHYSWSLYSFYSCLFYGFPVVWGSVFYLHVCVDDGLFLFRLGLHAFNVARILYIYTIKQKQYRLRLCIQANCRSVCYWQLNISIDFLYTSTSTTYR